MKILVMKNTQNIPDLDYDRRNSIRLDLLDVCERVYDGYLDFGRIPPEELGLSADRWPLPASYRLICGISGILSQHSAHSSSAATKTQDYLGINDPADEEPLLQARQQTYITLEPPSYFRSRSLQPILDPVNGQRCQCIYRACCMPYEDIDVKSRLDGEDKDYRSENQTMRCLWLDSGVVVIRKQAHHSREKTVLSRVDWRSVNALGQEYLWRPSNGLGCFCISARYLIKRSFARRSLGLCSRCFFGSFE
ncbi:hypothetical protein KCU88_g201, partial [Aureobasidium melanogenum]